MSSGASSFATKSGIESIAPERMIRDRTLTEWEHWRQKIARAGGQNVPLPQLISQEDGFEDTVGAVAFVSDAPEATRPDLAAGVSRCGLLRREKVSQILNLSQRTAGASFSSCQAESER